MNRIEALCESYRRYAALPWDRSLPGPQRVWFAVYEPAQERRLRLNLKLFEIATHDAGHSWYHCDLTTAFSRWMAQQDYREAYFEAPEDLPSPHPGFETFATEEVKATLAHADKDTVVAVSGVASLFGFMRVAELMNRVASAVPGRLLVFFPGEYSEGHYRLLDARDGWNYHAVPITAATDLETA